MFSSLESGGNGELLLSSRIELPSCVSENGNVLVVC